MGVHRGAERRDQGDARRLASVKAAEQGQRVLDQRERWTFKEGDEEYQAVRLVLDDEHEAFVRNGIDGRPALVLAANPAHWKDVAALLADLEKATARHRGMEARPIVQDARWTLEAALNSLEDYEDESSRKQRRRGRRPPADRALPVRAARLLDWPVPSGRDKIRADLRDAIEQEIAKLRPASRPAAFVSDWQKLGPDLRRPLEKAASRSIGAVVELIRAIRRERPDLDQTLKAAIEAQGVLTKNMKAVASGPGLSIELGLALVATVHRRILFAARYLIDAGEL